MKTPCEDCITLPVCKQRNNHLNYINLLTLCHKCFLLKDYCFNSHEGRFRKRESDIILNIFEWRKRNENSM